MLAEKQQAVLVFSSSNPEPVEYEKTTYEDEDEIVRKKTTIHEVVEKTGLRLDKPACDST